MNKKIVDIIKLSITLVIFLSISTVSKYILLIFNIDINNLTPKMSVLYQFVVSFIMFMVLLFIYFDSFKKDLFDFKKDVNKSISNIIKLFLIFMIVKYIISFISAFIIIILGYDTNSAVSFNQKILEKYIKAAPILMLISGSVLAPFYEEGIFRLGIKKVLDNKWVFIIISGTIFGLMHIFPLDDGVTFTLGLIQSISYVTMGIFLSYIYYKSDNIYTSIGVHFLNNFLSMLVMINML